MRLQPPERGGEEVRRPAPGRPAGEGGRGPPAVRREGRDGQNPPGRGQAGPGLLPGTQARRAPGGFLCWLQALACVQRLGDVPVSLLPLQVLWPPDVAVPVLPPGL